ncbi:MAG TPA: hypothetical protein VFJ46_08110 [Xanthobacteraceae bacterium]|nr:hypothetical protein [Xanthobacteraceae bacterium]
MRRQREEHTMSERAAENRKSGAADIVGVVFYSVLALLLTLAWMYVPA